MNATATQPATISQPQRWPTVQRTPYTQGFDDGREGTEYANPYRTNYALWVAYDTGHRDGRKSAAALAARGRG